MDILNKDLNIPLKYMHKIDNKISIIAHKNWLLNFKKIGKNNFYTHEELSTDEIEAQPSLDELGKNWTKLYAKIYDKKFINTIPLPRDKHSTSSKVQSDLTFPQLLRYVSETNYRNLWKDSYKKYSSPWNPVDNQKEQSLLTPSITDTSVMHQVLSRLYGCPLVYLENGNIVSINPASINPRTHCNLVPAIITIETQTSFIIFYEQTTKYSLQECVMFSPAALSTGYSIPLFLVYQLLKLSRDLHDSGLVLGEINLSDILILDNYTIQVFPKLDDNIYLKNHHNNVDDDDKKKNTFYKTNSTSRQFNLSNIKPFDFGLNEKIEDLCQQWINGQLSNFDYLTSINNLAGRKFGDPSCHHVMPWVTDFSSRNGKNWRDLSKSKYRLNKGDRQLDLTFDTQQTNEVGHHISDVLSEITYYVYLSRRYQKNVLCKHVRSQWVPGEYPVSIQRLQEWSPDECIPQFFIDPNVFKSIHEDLPDLELPSWARSPEDFIEIHREALESHYVSERLHQWIDLTFGYKLSGAAAIKSKNVCLQLVDKHTSLTNSGVVQLFNYPHPQKIVPSPYWSKIAPRFCLSNVKSSPKNERNEQKSEDEDHSSGFDEEELSVTTVNVARSSPLALSRLLSRSRSSLQTNEDSPRIEKPQTIHLPKDYNPIATLQHVEATHTFMNKITYKIYEPKIINQIDSSNYRQIVATARIKEQQIIGCLIVEIFMPDKFRGITTNKNSFTRRFETCKNVLNQFSDSLPKCIKNSVGLLLQVDVIPKTYGTINTDKINLNNEIFKYPTITYMGLPPPSSHQFLQSILSNNLFPSTKYFQKLYSIIEMLQEYKNIIKQLNYVLTDNDPKENIAKMKIEYLCKISESKVKSLFREFEKLFPYLENSMESSIQLIVPHIREIMNEPYCCVLGAWYLFDSIAKILGPKDTSKIFLTSIIKIYENGSILDCNPYANSLPHETLAKFKSMRLYHRSFLLRLMVRLGLKKFLDNFITPLVEAVGGYRDYPQGSLIYNQQSKFGNLKTCYLNGNLNDIDIILSPLDEDSSVDSENNITPTIVMTPPDNDIEEVFTMETEEPTKSSSSSSPPTPTIDLSLNITDDIIDDTIKQSTSSSSSTPSGVIKSPTIPIPKSDLKSIGCLIGSKTSSEDIPASCSYNNQSSFTLETDKLKAIDLSNEQAKNSDEELNISLSSSTSSSASLTSSSNKNINNNLIQESKVSDMSAESVIWLSHRLGPVLTARHLSRNLLRMLTLCYTGKLNLTPIDINDKNNILTGDINAIKVLECLTAISNLYGEQMILLQYFSHMAELLILCKRKLTPNLEGGIFSCLALLNHVTQYLSDTLLIESISEIIVKSILYPTVKILSTTKYTFPSGYLARKTLANKYLDVLSNLSIRLGVSTTKTHLFIPIQKFFLSFDKIYQNNNIEQELNINNKTSSYSPPIDDSSIKNTQINKAHEEIKQVFTPSLAHKGYLLLYRNLDETTMNDILKNHQLIRDLCDEHEKSLPNDFHNNNKTEIINQTTTTTTDDCQINDDNIITRGIVSFGNMTLVGNRIEVGDNLDATNRELNNLTNGRQLRGNWLAYWEHEIGRADKDLTFNIKQIKLQNFFGHTNSVRCLNVLDNENSFMSGGRDKTVKLWSIRSQGDGNTISSCQYTYTGHKKSILSIKFLESLRYAVTCDGSVHCWDPFMGSLLGCPESSKPTIINTIATSNPPSTSILVATTDITLKIIDCRIFQYVNELKVSMNPTGLIRCISISPNGNWVALGQASGFITIIDIRTGLIIASWKGHECEILQLEAIDDMTIVTSSLDQTIAVWNTIDGKLKYHLKGPTEPVHCMNIYEKQLITGTTANRIGVHTGVDNNSNYSSSKLRSDVFKGVLTAMTILPLNKLLLLGADNGGITLLC